MRNTIIIEDVIIDKGKIGYKYKIQGEWKKYFIEENEFFLEYNMDLSEVVESVAVIPFITNILPVAWVCDGEIIVKRIDEDFYNSIERIKDGYRNMYPMVDFKGKINVECIEKNVVESKKVSATFFSGGVDAYQTLLTHIKEKPILITLWGADVKLEDTKGWEKVKEHISSVSKNLDLEYCQVRSGFRSFLNEGGLSELVKDSKDGWWHGFQHGIGLIGHVAPIAYVYGLEKVYIASSFCEEVKGLYTCASDPTIDNNVSYCGCKTIHDGYEFGRQEKIRNIVTYKKENNIPINLRVCWESTGGSNCCQCEKCYRTILEIVSEIGDPNEFGFSWNYEKLKKCERDMKYRIIQPEYKIKYYLKPIQDNLNKNKEEIKGCSYYKWLMDMDMDNFNNGLIKKVRNGKSVRIIKKIKNELIKSKN